MILACRPFYVIFCLITSLSLHAELTCSKRQKSGGVRLDVPANDENKMSPKDKAGNPIDGSLKNARVTSQGSIGSCAGHSTSLLIKSARPDKPQIIPELIQACEQKSDGSLEGSNEMALIRCLARNKSRKYCPLKKNISLAEQIKIKSIQSARAKFLKLAGPDQPEVKDALRKIYFQLNTGLSSETATILCMKNTAELRNDQGLGRDPSTLLRLRHFLSLYKWASGFNSGTTAEKSKTRFINYGSIPGDEAEMEQQVKELKRIKYILSNQFIYCETISCIPGDIKVVEKVYSSLQDSIDKAIKFQAENRVFRGGVFSPPLKEKKEAFKDILSDIKSGLSKFESSIRDEGRDMTKVRLEDADIKSIRANMDDVENPSAKRALMRYKSDLVKLAIARPKDKTSKALKIFKRDFEQAINRVTKSFNIQPEVVRQDLEIVRKSIKKECSIETLEEMINFFPVICKRGTSNDFIEKVKNILNPLLAGHHPYLEFDPSIILDVFKPLNREAYSSRLSCKESEKFKVRINSSEFEFVGSSTFYNVPKYKNSLNAALMKKILKEEKGSEVIKKIMKVFRSNKTLLNCLKNSKIKGCAKDLAKVNKEDLLSHIKGYYPKLVSRISSRYARSLNKHRKQVLREKLLTLKENKASTIGVCSRIFSKNPRREPRISIPTGNEKYDEKNCGLHAVTVIGYRCKRGKIDYLIQNSYGTKACGSYRKSSKIECHDDKNHGKFWVSEDLLSKGVFDMTQLK